MVLGKSYWFWIGILLLTLLSYFVLFWNLDLAVMREWDEARNSANGLYMAKKGNYLVRYYDGQADMWETKPPLYVWLQVICLKIFGYDEWVFRLPSALGALGTVIVMARFLYQQTRSLLPGVVAVVVLLTTHNYTLHHCARSADHDALLILFELCLVISFYKYLTTETLKKNRYLLQCIVFFTLAVYTKSIAVVMILPGMFIYSLYRFKIVKLLKEPRFYIYTGASLLIIALYYYLHELQTPGYLKAVWENELFPRYLNTAKTFPYDKVKTPWQYGEVLAYHSIILIVLAPSLILAFINSNYRKAVGYVLVVAVTFYIVASLGTYNGWYINPIVPLLAMICGFGVYNLYKYIIRYTTVRNIEVKHVQIVLFLLAAILLYEPVRLQLTREVNYAKEYGYSLGMGKLLPIMRQEHPGIKTFKYCHPGRHNQTIEFYSELYIMVYNYNITYVKNYDNLQAGEKIMCSDEEFKTAIEKKYIAEPIVSFQDCILYNITGTR